MLFDAFLLVSGGFGQCVVSVGLKTHHSSVHLSSRGTLLSVCLNCSLLIRTQNTGFGPTQIQYGLLLISWVTVHLQRPYLQIRSHAQVPRGHEIGRGTEFTFNAFLILRFTSYNFFHFTPA